MRVWEACGWDEGNYEGSGELGVICEGCVELGGIWGVGRDLGSWQGSGELGVMFSPEGCINPIGWHRRMGNTMSQRIC